MKGNAMKATAHGIRPRMAVLTVSLVVAALALRVHLYARGAAAVPITTDEALMVLQAQDIRNGEFPLLIAGQPYMFPMESYWMAPVVRWLPRTAAGMRLPAMAEGVLLTGIALWILLRTGRWREIWPGALVAMFPSAYVLCTQGVYPIFAVAAILVLLALACAVVLDPPDGGRRAAWLEGRALREGGVAFAGACCLGLAVTNSLSALGMAVPLAVAALWNTAGRGDRKAAAARLAGFAAGGWLGLLPHLWARWTIPHSHQAVTTMFTVKEAWGRFWEPTLAGVLPGTFGWRACLWPDSGERLSGPAWLLPLFGCAALAVFACGVALAASGLARAVRKERRWPLLGPFEWALGVSAAGVVLFTLNRRASPSDYRYMLPVAHAFPFLVAGLWSRLRPRPVRWAAAAAVAGLCAFNSATALRLAREWKAPDFAERIMSTPDLSPALDVLRRENIHHAVASHWVAYRVDFESGGGVVCAQPRNERFAGWPLPYKAEVDASEDVAYVLTDAVRFLKPALFEEHMRTMGVEADVIPAGAFRVYCHFRHGGGAYRALPVDAYRVSANCVPEDAPAMADGRMETFWRNPGPQTAGLAVECSFAAPVPLAGVRLRYGTFAHDRPLGLAAEVLRGGEWTAVEIGRVQSEPFHWANGHPVYSDFSTDRLEFTSVQTGAEAVRISIVRARPRMSWTLCEVEPLVFGSSGVPVR